MRVAQRTLYSLFRRVKQMLAVRITKLLKMPPAMLSAILVALSFVTGSGGLSACAADIRLPPQETRDLIGATIPARCYNGTGYTDFNFSYGGTTQVISVTGSNVTGITAGDTVIYYTADLTTVSTDPQYITVDIRPEYSFFDTQYIYQYIALSSNYSYPTPATSAYAPPSWRWHDSRTGDVIYESQSTYNNGANYGYFRASADGSTWDSTFIEATLQGSSDFSAYSYRACFYGNSLQSGRYMLFISCPVVTDTSTMASGTGITGTSGGSSGDVNVSVIVDNSDVVSALEGLGSYPAETATTVATLPTDLDIEGALTGANDVIDELPEVVESTGFWLYFLGRLFGITYANVPVFQSFALVLVLLSIFMYVLWRK